LFLPISHSYLKVSFVLICIFCLPAVLQGAETLSVHVVDVGYADAIVIDPSTDAACLIDAGGKEAAAGLVEYIKKLNKKRIEKVVLTHGHENHYAGVPAILQSFKVGDVYINPAGSGDEGYEDFLIKLKESGANVSMLQAKQTFSCINEDIQLTFFLPVLSRTDSYSINDNAVVTYLTFKKHSFLLTSDVGEKVQEILLKENPFLKDASVVQVPHHGKALSEALIETMRNKIFFVSTGSNFWGLPDEMALGQLDGTLYRTDRHKTIVFETDGEHIKVRLTP